MAVTQKQARIEFIRTHLPPKVSLNIDHTDMTLLLTSSSGWRSKHKQEFIEDLSHGGVEGFINRIWVSEGLPPLFSKGAPNPLGMGSSPRPPQWNDADAKQARTFSPYQDPPKESFIDWLVKEKDKKDG